MFETNTNNQLPKKLGVTHAIREKLNFLDDRKWKKFSARRLELIDTLDLSSKKASEQESTIHSVAEALRTEFEYSSEYFEEFEKLTRAAIQSVRRNRKRSTKKTNFKKRINKGDDKTKVDDYSEYENDSTTTNEPNFMSEIVKLSEEEVNDYSRSKLFTDNDKSRVAIHSMIQPRINKKVLSETKGNFLPMPIKKPNIDLTLSLENIKKKLLNYIEKSKTCSEAAISSKTTQNLEFLGKGIIISSVGYVFETSFIGTNTKSLEYLRDKLTQESYLANFYRNLDPHIEEKFQFNDKIAVSTLYTILGSCIKDFGFEIIMFPLCELIYLTIIKEYPLIEQTSIPFKSCDHLKTDPLLQLNSLATIASDIRQEQLSGEQTSFTQSNSSLKNISRSLTPIKQETGMKKSVKIKYLSTILNFTFPSNTSSIPKLDELLENVRSAFQLTSYNHVLGLKDLTTGIIIKSDFDLERIFNSQDSIDLEIFIQQSHEIPIYEITSMIVPNKLNNNLFKDEKIILPPPISKNNSIDSTSTSFKFLSNLDDSKTNGPPTPVLPRFQPLL